MLTTTTEESFYGLCENGTIQKQTVLGTTTYWLFYNLVDGISLIPEKAVVWSLEEAQYYAGPTEVDVEPISKGEAGEILVREYANARVAVTYFDNKAEALEQYREILDVYVTALEEKWNPATCSEKGISILISNYVETPEQIGYGFMDIDMNGNLELIMTDGNAILDLYALTKDGPELVISGWERNTYYLHDGFAIFNHASNSASSTTYNICHLVDGSLLTEQRIIFDATEDPDNPWFHQLEGDKVTPITEEEAREIMESFASLTIDFTPMTEYSMWGMSDQTR